MVAYFRASGLALLSLAFAVLIALLGVIPGVAQPRPPVQAELSATIADGFGRLIFAFTGEVKTEVQLANNILVVKFDRPVKVAVDEVQQQLRGLVQVVRADPDGTGVRLAMRQKVSVNSMEAGEKLFVDILPATWVGLPPGLPQEVVDDLARRARDAERRARTQPPVPEKVWQPIQLRFAESPGFSRYAFVLPEPLPVSVQQDGQEFRIRFAAPVKIDLGEAQVQLPPGVVMIDADYENGAAVARIVLAPGATLRHFNEEGAFVVDVTPSSVVPRANIETVAPAPAPPLQTPAADAPLRPELPALVKAEAPQPEIAPTGPVTAAVIRANDGMRIAFPFKQNVAAAVFRRGDWVWIVFDTLRVIDIAELIDDKSRIYSDATLTEIPDAKVLRLKLRRHWLVSVDTDGETWTVQFGDAVATPSVPLNLRRVAGSAQAAIVVPLEGASGGKVHLIADLAAGDDVRVVTAKTPARGILRMQTFVDFQLLGSAHGVAVVPLADDLEVALRSEYVTIGRPRGLALSMPARVPDARPDRRAASPIDATVWEGERNRRFQEREAEIAAIAAAAPPNQRADARIALATFYIAHQFSAEAKGVLDTIVKDGGVPPDNPKFHLLRGLSELMLGRSERALAELLHADLAPSHDAALLRAIAHAELSNWSDAREHFRIGVAGLKLLPVGLQRRVLLAVFRAAIEVRDFTEAGRLVIELEALEIPDEHAAEVAMLSGRLAEGLGRVDRAETLFEAAARGPHGPASAEAKFRQVELRFSRGEFNRAKAIDRLEDLSFAWRGDRIELESNRLLARLYVAEARYRDAFRLLDHALLAQSKAALTRTFQNEMAAVFEDVFLSGKAEGLPAIEALALYYDFSKLTPNGRRGDELIRRLSDRLVSVDLLDQAAEILEHQVQFRLSGAAKSQVATRLAVVHLMNRKPQRAVAVLAATRQAELPKDLREQRLLLEARGLMDANRPDAALDLVENLKGYEADRLRADILWSAKRWRLAGEALERILGERWKEAAVLTEIERHDVLRAALGYALTGETVGLSRLKEKFAAKLAGGPERAALDQIAVNADRRAIGAAASAIAQLDSLGTFLKLYQAKYPATALPERGPANQLSAR